MRQWLANAGAKTLHIEPGSPWENGYVASFNGKLRDELLNQEVFYTLLEVQVLTGQYRQSYQATQLPGLPASGDGDHSACGHCPGAGRANNDEYARAI